MPQTEKYEVLIIGSGEAGKYMAWTMAKAGHRTAVVERKLVGGSCPNVACLPSKNIIFSAKVASLARRGAEFGLAMGSLGIDMAGVQRRKRKMVEDLIQTHLNRYQTDGAELIMGMARFIGARTVEVSLAEGGTRVVAGDRVFLNLGTRASIPDVPGLAASQPMTHVEALDLDRLPDHLIVVGAGYVGLELTQAMRRLGAKVTVIEREHNLRAGRTPTSAPLYWNYSRAKESMSSSTQRCYRSRGVRASRFSFTSKTAGVSKSLEDRIFWLPLAERLIPTELDWNRQVSN